jgi:hypothetical protein
MPGLIRGVARTAAVAGTATAVSNRVSRRQTQRWAEQDATAAPPAPAAPPQAAAGGIAPNTVEQLKQLGQLHEQGVLTDEEFAAQKAKVLGT